MQGMNMMKYAMNHPWKFTNWQRAFFIGFSQAFMIFAVEAVNMIVLLTNHTMLDTVMNFLALVIIADFDDYLFTVV